MWLSNPRFGRAPLNKPHGDVEYCLEMEQTVHLEYAVEAGLRMSQPAALSLLNPFTATMQWSESTRSSGK